MPSSCDSDAIQAIESEANVSNASEKTKLESLWLQRQNSIIRHVVRTSDNVTLVKRGSRYVISKQSKLRNNLLAGVGFLELANAGDFAANIWNEIPVPIYAIVLMAFGGTLALFLSYYAFTDHFLSWKNLRFLREERRSLIERKRSSSQGTQVIRDLQTRLSVNRRDIGTELINRLIMDTLMGFGAVTIGIGTLMAIDGADHKVFIASNLLSGYIGNVPLALYAIINAAWCSYIWINAHRHSIAGAKVLGVEGLGLRLQCRCRNIQIYAFTYGLTGICGGVGSLLVATRWWGYCILVPVIISSIICNYMWRRKIGYDRPPLQEFPTIEQDSLIQELDFVSSICQELQSKSLISPYRMTLSAKNIRFVIDLITSNDLFEEFSQCLLKDTDLCTKFFGDLAPSVTVSAEKLLNADAVYLPRILEIAQTCIYESSPAQFQYQERYLLDILGYFLCTSDAPVTGKAMEMV